MLDCEERGRTLLRNTFNIFYSRQRNVTENSDLRTLITFRRSGISLLLITSVSSVYLLTPWSRVLLEKLTGSAASQEIPRIFGTRSSSPYSQVPATCPYPNSTPSSPHNPLPLPEGPS